MGKVNAQVIRDLEDHAHTRLHQVLNDHASLVGTIADERSAVASCIYVLMRLTASSLARCSTMPADAAGIELAKLITVLRNKGKRHGSQATPS